MSKIIRRIFPAGAPDEKRNVRLLGVVLAVLTVGLYVNTLSSPFLFDDAGAILHNPTIRHWRSWAIFHPPSDGSTTTGRPLLNASYALNFAWTGERVWSYHVVNIALHALCAVLVFAVMLRLCRRAGIASRLRGSPVIFCFAAAWWWAWHPLQTESVVGIAQRTELLGSSCYLLSIYLFLRSFPSRLSFWTRFFSVAAAAAGMAAKETVATLPLMVLLIDRACYAKSWSELLRNRGLYYFGLAATWLVLLALLAGSGWSRGASAGFGLGVSSWHYLCRQAGAILLYLRLAVWPYPLVLDYGTATAEFSPRVALEGMAVLGLLGATIWAYLRRPALGLLGVWFFLILAPSSSFIPLVGQTVAEHRMYLPLLAVIAGSLYAFQFWAPRWFLTFVIAGAAALGGTTSRHDRNYRDALTIWSDNVAEYPSSARAQNNLGIAELQGGNPTAALASFRRALALDPAYVSALYNLGATLLSLGQFSEAGAALQRVVELAPGHADAQLDLGNALMRSGQPAVAVSHYEAALALGPSPDIYYNLGLGLAAVGERTHAMEAWEQAVALDPSFGAAHRELARARFSIGELTGARREFIAALQTDPQDFDAHLGFGVMLAQSGELGNAETELRAARALRPASLEARANLGNVLLLSGRFQEALDEYQEVLRADPQDPRVIDNIKLAREELEKRKD